MAEGKKREIPEREAGMSVAVGSQGVGKSWKTKMLIYDMVKGDMALGTKGSKVIVMDTNGEYTDAEFDKMGMKGFTSRKIALDDVQSWCLSPLVECRRIDAKSLSMDKKLETLEYLIKVCRDVVLIIDDINTYVLNVTHLREIVGGLVNLRHRACDVIVSYQSLRAVEPRMIANCRWVRMHYQSDDVYDVKGKLGGHLELFKIAQILVNAKYFGGDKRFYVHVMKADNKVKGKFSKKEFAEACFKYLKGNNKIVKQFQKENAMKEDEAMKSKVYHLVEMYYGNGN